MAFPQRLLGEDEQLVTHVRPHWKTLVVPVLLAPVLIGAGAFGVAAMPSGSAQYPARLAVLALTILLLAVFGLVPGLGWRTTHLVLTTHRVITRSGIISRTGRDIPLGRVNDVTFSHHLVERLLRCGTLVIESGGERGQLVLEDIPRVERVQRQLAELVDASLELRAVPPAQRRASSFDGERDLDSDPGNDPALAGD